MATIYIELTPKSCRLRGSWLLTASYLEPAGPRRAVVLEGAPLFDQNIDLEVVASSGPVPIPNWIRFTLIEADENSQEKIQVLYCRELRIEERLNEPTMFQVAVELPAKLFESLWRIVSEIPLHRIKVGVSFNAKDDVSGHFPILEIEDLGAKGFASTAGDRFWFDISSSGET